MSRPRDGEKRKNGRTPLPNRYLRRGYRFHRGIPHNDETNMNDSRSLKPGAPHFLVVRQAGRVHARAASLISVAFKHQRLPWSNLIYTWITHAERLFIVVVGTFSHPIVKVPRRVCNLRLDSDSNECCPRIFCSYPGTFFAAPRRTLTKTSSTTASDCRPAKRDCLQDKRHAF
jgi:hypothetical protein